MASIANQFITHSNIASPRSGTPFASAFAPLASAFRRWGGRIRERNALAGLSDRELRDIGLSSSDVYAELAKPFWRG